MDKAFLPALMGMVVYVLMVSLVQVLYLCSSVPWKMVIVYVIMLYINVFRWPLSFRTETLWSLISKNDRTYVTFFCLRLMVKIQFFERIHFDLNKFNFRTRRACCSESTRSCFLKQIVVSIDKSLLAMSVKRVWKWGNWNTFERTFREKLSDKLHDNYSSRNTVRLKNGGPGSFRQPCIT